MATGAAGQLNTPVEISPLDVDGHPRWPDARRPLLEAR